MRRGFTLIELLVVIAIIGILASVIFVSLSSARAKGRDANRLATLHQMQNALELYANDHNGLYPSTSGGWWGSCSAYGNHGLTGASGYIPNLAPQYVGLLPADPNPNQTSCSTYLYNSNGTDYILLSYFTVEGYTQSTNPSPRPAWNGVASPCGASGYEPDFAIYTPGARCW